MVVSPDVGFFYCSAVAMTVLWDIGESWIEPFSTDDEELETEIQAGFEPTEWHKRSSIWECLDKPKLHESTGVIRHYLGEFVEEMSNDQARELYEEALLD